MPSPSIRISPPRAVTTAPGLYPTLWAADHGDVARSHSTPYGGFSASVTGERLRVLANPALYHPTFCYTRDADELFVYGRGDLRRPSYIAKVDALTLEIRQRLPLPWSLYLGGGVVHASGDVFLVHCRRLYRFPQGDLAGATFAELPAVNGVFTAYNGLTVGADLRLILKSWAMCSADWKAKASFMRRASAPGLALALTLGAGVALSPWALLLPALGLSAALWGLRHTGTSLRQFRAPPRPGSLHVVDPETLSLCQSLPAPERLGIGRLSLAPRAPAGQWLIAVGDRAVHRWRYLNGALRYDPEWTGCYRAEGDGTYPGAAPAVVGDSVSFTNNVAPIGLVSPRFTTHSKSLSDSAPLSVRELPTNLPGFNYWSQAFDAGRGLLITWDIANERIEARDVSSGQLRWSQHLLCTDSISLVQDRGLLYACDYDSGLTLQEYALITGPAAPRSRHTKRLVVIDVETGEVRARLDLGTTGHCLSSIVPGAHSDVFVGMRDGLLRVVEEIPDLPERPTRPPHLAQEISP